jgi:hypothetical protein
MQYLLLIYGQESDWSNIPPAQAGALMGEFSKFTEELVASGKNLGSHRLKDVASATTVRVRDGKRVVTDGPFAETKEQLGGYYLIEAKDLDEAIAIAAKVPSARFGSVEVRPVWTMEQAAGR